MADVVQQSNIKTHEDLSTIDKDGFNNTQRNRSPQQAYKMVTFFNIDTPAFNKTNNISIDATDMVVEDAYIEFNLSAVSGPTTPSLAPTSTWVDRNGVSLNFKNSSIYTASEPELLMYNNFTSDPDVQVRVAQATNNVPIATRISNGLIAHRYYLSLKPISDKILSKIGPLSAYASKTWSLSISLVPLANIVEGGSASAGVVTINGMRLVLIGHRSVPAEADRVAKLLASDGLNIYFTGSNSYRNEYAASASGFTQVFSDLEGNVSDLFVCHRVKAGFDATGPQTTNKTQYQLLDNANDLISVGTSSFPNLVYGQQINNLLSKQLLMGHGYPNSAKTMFPLSGLVGLPGGTESEMNAITFANVGYLDQVNGSSTGSLYVRNDLRLNYSFGTTVTANYIDMIVYLHRKMNITFAKVNIENSQ